MFWTYNGINMSEYMRVIDIRGRGVSPYELMILNPTGSEEDFVTYRSTPQRRIEIDFEIRGKSRDDLRQKIDELSAILVVNEKVPVTFSDEPNITYLCEYLGATESAENPHVFKHRGTITLLRDRYKYGPEQTVNFIDSTTVTNPGTVEAKPVVELTALQKVTFAMVSDGANYNMVGTPSEVEQTTVDEKTVILDEIGDTINSWTPSGQGSFRKGAAGIVVQSYGSGSEWHGPILTKEITPTKDFEIEFFVSVRSETPDKTFRASLNFYDENMNQLGLLRLWDNSSKIIQIGAEARVGPYFGDHRNYLITNKNYNLPNRKVWNGLLRVTRKGNKYTFYIARIAITGHANTLKVTYTDTKKEYDGLLKFVRIDIANWGTTGQANEIEINRVKVTKFNTITTDQTPYIAEPGDVFLFDHDKCQITKNGENIKNLKDFGGTYFTIPSGISSLTVLPDGAFDAKLTFKPRYR